MIFRFNLPVPSNTGTGIRSLFIPYINDNHLDIKKSGDFDLQAQIEAEACLCDLTLLIERMQNGDVEALNRRQAFYSDMTAYPSSYREAFDILRDGREFYNSLSQDERDKYSGFEDFMSSDFVSRFADRIDELDNSNDNGGSPDEQE